MTRRWCGGRAAPPSRSSPSAGRGGRLFLGARAGGAQGAGVANVEGGAGVGVAVGAEAVGVEAVGEAARAAVLGQRLDAHLVLAGARRRAVGQEVEAPRVAIDAGGDALEGLLDLGGVLL